MKRSIRKAPVSQSDLDVKLTQVVGQVEIIGKVVLGNGDPTKGLVVTMVRIETKLDGLIASVGAHTGDKSIHRTELDSQKKMLGVALWLVPVVTAGVVFIVLTVSGQWSLVGKLMEGWMGIP